MSEKKLIPYAVMNWEKLVDDVDRSTVIEGVVEPSGLRLRCHHLALGRIIFGRVVV